jgi:hypothetical protein
MRGAGWIYQFEGLLKTGGFARRNRARPQTVVIHMIIWEQGAFLGHAGLDARLNGSRDVRLRAPFLDPARHTALDGPERRSPVSSGCLLADYSRLRRCRN